MRAPNTKALLDAIPSRTTGRIGGEAFMAASDRVVPVTAERRRQGRGGQRRPHPWPWLAAAVSVVAFSLVPGSAAGASSSAMHTAKPFHVTPRGNRPAPTIRESAALTHPVASGSMKAQGLRPSRTPSGSEGAGSKSARSAARAAGLGTTAAKDPLFQANGFEGTAQAQAVYDFGTNQEVAPPDGGVVAAGPSDIGEVTNSALYFYRRNVVEHA